MHVYYYVHTKGNTLYTTIQGLAGLERPEQPTVICASSFFTSYLKLVESSESIQSVVSEKGVSLVQYILQAIAGAAPRSYLTSFTEVLVALCIYCTSQLSQWLEVCVLLSILEKCARDSESVC